MSRHPLTNFEIENEPKFNPVYLRNNLYKIKNSTYVINFDERKSIGTRWVTLHVNDKIVTYFVSLGVEHTSKYIKDLIGIKNIATIIYRTQAFNSILCIYFCNEFISFMLKGKSLLDNSNLFSFSKYEKIDKMILKYF